MSSSVRKDGGRGLRILVIDSDVAHVDFVAGVVEGQGHEIIRAHDGEEGLARFFEDLPDLVMLDLMLPKLDGATVCAKLRESSHGLFTPFMIVTGGYRNESKLRTMRELGAVDYLSKPVTGERLATRMAKVLQAGSGSDATLEVDELNDLVGEREESVSIADGGLPELLVELYQEERSGLLVATDGDTHKLVELDGGLVVGAISNLAADGLDEVLLTKHLLTRSEVVQARHREEEQGEQFADAVRALELFENAALDEAIACHAATILLSLLSWRQGDVAFVAGKTAVPVRVDDALDSCQLALAGVRRSDWYRETIVASNLEENVRYSRSDRLESIASKLSLTIGEQNVLSLIDGARTLRDLRRIGSYLRHRIDEPLAVLVTAGLVNCVVDEIEQVSPDGEAAVATPVRGVAGGIALRPLVELVGSLSRDRATGTLTVEGSTRCSFSFREGQLVFARSSAASDRLGQVLLKRGVITQRQLDDALDKQRSSHQNELLGTILIQMGVLSLDGLHQASRRLVEQIVESTFSWTEGKTSFTPKADNFGHIDLGMSCYELLRRGASLLPTPSLEERWCRPRAMHVLHGCGEPDESLESDEQELLAACEAGLDLDQAPGIAEDRPAALARIQFMVAAGLVRVESIEVEEEIEITLEAEDEIEIIPEAIPVMTSPAETQPIMAAVAPEPSMPGRDPVAGLLAYLGQELVADDRVGEAERRRLGEKIGELKERSRRLEAENTALLKELALAR